MSSYQSLLVGFDPGKTTGYCVVKRKDFSLSWFPYPVMFGVVTNFQEISDLLEVIGREDIYSIVMEQFRLYPNKAKTLTYSDFPAAEVIGVIKFLCGSGEYKIPYIFQPAGMAKQIDIPSEIKKYLKTPHARDAYAHIVCMYHRLFDSSQEAFRG